LLVGKFLPSFVFIEIKVKAFLPLMLFSLLKTISTWAKCSLPATHVGSQSFI